MRFDNIPEWAAWLAQDADGTWHLREVGRGCKVANASTATLWAYEAEPNKQDRGWYENEVGRSSAWGKPRLPPMGKPR